MLVFMSGLVTSLAGADDSIGERFKGEVLKYEIGFWIFRRLGEGEATFRDLGNGRYMAFHEAKTLGLAGWISRYRRDVYRSTMGTIDNGKRLIPLRFEEDVIIGKTTRNRITVYDYGAGKVRVETRKDNTPSREEIDIPPGFPYDDPMTAFYNFRAEVYGKIEPGKHFSIHTVPREGSRKTIRLDVASKKEADRRRAQEAEKAGKEFLVIVHLDKELVGSLHGLVDTWFSADRVPIAGVAKDVFFWGDITGRLTYRGFAKTPDALSLRPDATREKP